MKETLSERSCGETGHKNWVLCIAWSPDGKLLLSGSKDGELRLWEPTTGKAIGNPLTVCFSFFINLS
jgi:WD40 repeat protein